MRRIAFPLVVVAICALPISHDTRQDDQVLEREAITIPVLGLVIGGISLLFGGGSVAQSHANEGNAQARHEEVTSRNLRVAQGAAKVALLKGQHALDRANVNLANIRILLKKYGVDGAYCEQGKEIESALGQLEKSRDSLVNLLEHGKALKDSNKKRKQKITELDKFNLEVTLALVNVQEYNRQAQAKLAHENVDTTLS